jgi:tRNA A22 N-methylase
MKNVDKVRKELINLGYSINKDYLFYDKKYYNLLVSRLGEMKELYTERELIFGRDNLKQRSDDFMLYLTREIAIMEGCVNLIESPSELETVSQRIKLFKEVLNGN